MKRIFIFTILSFLVFNASAQTNYALSFNGTNNYITIGTPLSTNTSYTKEAWVYQTSSTGSQNIISSLNAPFWISAGTLSAGQAGSFSAVTDPTVFPLNRWVFVAVTYDAPTTTMKLYRDGILITTNSAVAAYTSENTFIGSHQGSTSFFLGSMDEIRIWSIALTQAQLKQNMYKGPANNSAGLLAYYKFNDGSGSTLTSSSTNMPVYNGTLQNSPAWVASPVQFSANAISFDGTNDAVTIPYNSSLDISSAITLEAWIYATKNSGIQNVISKSSNTANTSYIFPRTDDGWAHVVIYFYIGGGWKTLSAVYPSLNAWHHLAATFDGTLMKLYIDGTMAASQTQIGTIATNANVLALGNQTGFAEYFGGYGDEFRVWNVARTQTEIQNNRFNELDPTIQTGLVSYYTANQGINAGTNTGMTTIIDQKGVNNGLMSNFALSGASSNFVTQNIGITILPVSLVRFTAEKKDKTVLLKWITASEQNAKEFAIQHSIDGNNWDEPGKVAASGNSNTPREYSYVHTNPGNGINYYRLLQTDLDGRGSFSDIRTVQFNKVDPSFIVLNNPVNDGILQVKLIGNYRLSFYSGDGRLLWQKQAATGTETINVSGYAKGIYFLKGNDQTAKIILH